MTSALAAVENLQTLVASRCPRLSNIFMRIAAFRCNSSLTALDVSYNSRITNEGVAWLAGGMGRTGMPCKLLKLLNVSHCPKINDKALHYLSWSCWNMRYINVSHNAGVKDGGVKDLLAVAKHLRIADFGHCPEVGVCVRCRCCCCCRCVMLLMLFPRVLQLTDEALWQLASTCPKLRTLSLSKNNTMTDTGLIAVAVNCTELHRLKIDECLGFSSPSVLALSQNCPALQVGCPQREAVLRPCDRVTMCLCVWDFLRLTYRCWTQTVAKTSPKTPSRPPLAFVSHVCPLQVALRLSHVPSPLPLFPAQALRYAERAKTYIGLMPRVDRTKRYFKVPRRIILRLRFAPLALTSLSSLAPSSLPLAGPPGRH